MGWEAQIVYLFAPDNTSHTIAEIRKDEQVYLADLYQIKKQKRLLPKSVHEVSSNDDLIIKTWSVKQHRAAIENSGKQFWTPSYPQDHRPRNQQLYYILRKNLGSRCPRFGEDPFTRRSNYTQLMKENERDSYHFGVYFFPFRLLCWKTLMAAYPELKKFLLPSVIQIKKCP